MKLGVYSFLDSQIGLFSVPFFQSHPAIAKRMASDLASDPNTTIGKHPECFSLYLLADFDDNTGVFTPIAPMMVCTCSSLLPAPLPALIEQN